MRIKRPLVCKHSARAGTDLENMDMKKRGQSFRISEKQGQTLRILGTDLDFKQIFLSFLAER